MSVMDEVKADLEKAIRTIKIEVNSREREELNGELERFLKWLEPLLAVETGSVEPVLLGHGALNVLSEDRAEPGETAKIHKAASNFEEGFYKVPPIME